MKYKTIVAAMLLAGSVNASPGDDGCVGNCGGNDNGIDNTNRNTNSNVAGAYAKSNANSNSKSIGVGIGMGGNSDSRSTSSATGGNAGATAFGGKGGAGGQGGTALGVQGQAQKAEQANAQSMTYNEADSMHYSGEVKTVGYAVAPDIQPTAGCRKPLSVGLGVMGGALSMGTTFLDETCVRGELIRFGLTSRDAKTNQMTDELLQYDLAKELEIARNAEAKESAKKVSNQQTDASTGFDLLNYNDG